MSVKLSLSLHRQTTKQLSKERDVQAQAILSFPCKPICCASAAVLKIVTQLALERIPHTIICVGASHSDPYRFYSLSVPTWMYVHALMCDKSFLFLHCTCRLYNRMTMEVIFSTAFGRAIDVQGGNGGKLFESALTVFSTLSPLKEDEGINIYRILNIALSKTSRLSHNGSCHMHKCTSSWFFVFSIKYIGVPLKRPEGLGR